MNQWVGVLGAEETLELGGVTPSICGISSESKPARPRARCSPLSGIDPDRIAGGKIAMYFERAGRQQRGHARRESPGPAPASTTIVPRGSAAKPIHRRP